MGPIRRELPVWLIALVLVAVVAVAATVYYSVSRMGRTEITAFFDSSVGVSQGTDVRILGVTVGSVDEVIPRGEVVEVKMHVDRGVDVPADAKAAQVTPSVVPDRTVQLLPAYSGGPKMDSGATIPRERTTTPVEIDKLYASVEKLTTALGPEGANKNGAVNRFLTASAEDLGGNGEALGRSLTELSKAAGTLSDSRNELTDTVTNLQTFVTMLAENDRQVRDFNTQMATFNETVATQRADLQGALRELGVALADVARLVRDNQDLIKTNADRLAQLSQITADQKTDLVEILKVAPLALTNLIEAYDSESGTLQMRVNIPELQSPASVLCKLMDLSRLKPGDPTFQRLGDQQGPSREECEKAVPHQNAQLAQVAPNLPFGIMQNEINQSVPVPGTVPGATGWTQRPASEGGR